ncbi:hypothetical protein MATL_G00238630 [Megalops atlanticus]|uniref:Uncharacterized protein n=1 Tax=Megalops atlanticus TaxID=7932 RepID=A0A9D3PEC9_MEGAT|nr:hypothetical protein MATL_G00238630 [Megalops atlanticus]
MHHYRIAARCKLGCSKKCIAVSSAAGLWDSAAHTEPGDRKHGGGRVCCKPFAEVRCPQSAAEERTTMWRL